MLTCSGSGSTAFYGWVTCEKHDAKEAAKDAKRKADRVQKKFEYFCPHCLFQTNEYSKVCPECRRSRLEKTIDKKYISAPKLKKKRSIFDGGL